MGGFVEVIPLELTPRQIEVCILAGCGPWMSNKAIALELDISIHTVDIHLRDAAMRIRDSYPSIGRGPPRTVCQAWVRSIYHAMASRALSRAA